MPVCSLEESVMELAEAAFALSAVVVECTVNKSVNNSLKLGISLNDSSGIVALFLELLDIFNSCAEDVLVLNACALSDFDVCAVPCAESYGTVEHELHVTCTGSLETCG